MADAPAYVEPIPKHATRDFAVTADPFVATRVYEVLALKTSFVTVNTTAPIFSNLSPAAGVPIEPTDPISFDVTDDEGLFRRIIIAVVDLENGLVELVHDGDAFMGFFIEESDRTVISGGIHYTILRRGGWDGTSLEVKGWAIDPAGNEGTLG